jgi:hypothetical protein
MKQPPKSGWLEPSVGAPNVPQSITREDKASARKAAKSDWNAGPVFPVASDLALWGKAVSAASRAGSTLDAALAFAQADVPVFPVSSVGQKKPLNAHGVYSATTDPVVVGRDFGQHSNALIAVPMGRRTGVFAIDVDAAPPHAHDGIAAWRALEANYGVTQTRIHRTASGGLHLLFCWPPERQIGCAVKGLPKGIECKGEGGSIIFPPSERSAGKYSVVSDVDPAHAPDWLLDMVAPVGVTRAATPLVYRKTHVDAEGSPYGLKALDNACAKLVSALPGERDRAIGENVLAIGSLAAGGELDEHLALQSLKRASQSNPGSDSNYWDKIERAFETGKENPRSAPPKRNTPRSTTKQGSNAPETMKSCLGSEANDDSCPSCPSYPHVLNQREKEKKSASGFDELIEKVARIDLTKEDSVPTILAEAVQRRLPDLQTEMLIKALAKKAGVGVRPLRSLLLQSRAEVTATQSGLDGPAACQLEQEEQRRRREVDDMREAIQGSSSKIALSDTILKDMEAVVHGLGVVGESAAIRGAYLAATSRLLRNHAICLLRRGAAAGGKNFLLSTVFHLIPSESVVVLSSGSPMSLVYYGGGDEDALKHKILYVQEAAILAEKNGVESSLTILLRLLISEGQIDHLLVVPNAGDRPATMKIKRSGPVAVCITSARDNIESEMLTRLLTSDADESAEQTMAVVKGLLSVDETGEQPDLAPWLDFQRGLELDAPYDVTLPFGVALYNAYENRLKRFPDALQLRMRRDISGLISAIKTSAVLHKANRETDARGRIVATIDDYRHAHEAFDEGVSSLYGVKTRKEIIAVVKAVEELGGKLGESLKVTVAALRQRLGINSNSTASDRLMEAVERRAIELDEEKSGSGRGAPRYFRLMRSSAQIAAEPGQGVFPSPEDVLREINILTPVGPGHGDKTDKTDKTEQSARTSAVPPKKAPGWSARL